MVVGDFYSGIHHRAEVFVNATCEVDIFGIHEKSRVE